MISHLIHQLTDALRLSWCGWSHTEFHGLAEILTKDKVRAPVEICEGEGNQIFADSATQHQAFFLQNGNIQFRESRRQTWGKTAYQDFNITLSLIVVGKRKALNESCGNTLAEFAIGLFDSLPRESFNVSDSVKNVRVTSSTVNTASSALLQRLYGATVAKRSTDIFATEVVITSEGTLCASACGDTVQLCPDVTVTDTDSTVYEVGAGGSFVCSAPAPPVMTMSINFNDGVFFQSYRNAPAGAQITFADSVLTGISSAFYFVNGISVANPATPYTFGDRDTIGIFVVKSGGLAGVTLSFNLQTTIVIRSCPEFNWIEWQNLADCVIQQDWAYDHATLLSEGTPSGWQKSARGQNNVSVVRFYYVQQTFQGLSQTFAQAGNHWSDFDVALQTLNGAAQLYENGALQGTLSGASLQGAIFEMEDTGSSIAIRYSRDNGTSWTFWRNSTTYSSGPYFPVTCFFQPYCRHQGILAKR